MKLGVLETFWYQVRQIHLAKWPLKPREGVVMMTMVVAVVVVAVAAAVGVVVMKTFSS